MHILILNDFFLFLRVKWVTFYGTKYQPGMIVAEGHDGLMPIFAQVKFLLALPDKRVFFLCKRVQILRFVHHLWAFEVVVMNTECILDYNSLHEFHPLDLYSIDYDHASRKFVRPKYHIHDQLFLIFFKIDNHSNFCQFIQREKNQN